MIFRVPWVMIASLVREAEAALVRLPALSDIWPQRQTRLSRVKDQASLKVLLNSESCARSSRTDD